MKKYEVYYRHIDSTFPESYIVVCDTKVDAIRVTLESLEEKYWMNPVDVDICHIEEVKD